jgi:hypothetical protein
MYLLIHQHENNAASQAQLELRRDDFNEQCWEVLTRMLNGEKLSSKSAINTGIGDIRRRAKDLIDHKGIPVRREWATENGVRQPYKWYYIEADDRVKYKFENVTI